MCIGVVLTISLKEITKLNNGDTFTRNPGVQLLERYLASDFFLQR